MVNASYLQNIMAQTSIDSPDSPENRLKKIFVDPKHQAKIVDYLVHGKPSGWSRKSNAPYYREEYALQLKKVADQMMTDRQDVFYPYDDYLEQYGISRETLYLRINQSKRYLLEQLDPDHIYARFFERVRIERERGVGIMIRFIPEFRDGPSDFKPRTIEPVEQKYKWQKDMDIWLEESNPGDEPFYKDKLALSPEEITALKIQLKTLSNVLSSITVHTIKLVKINVDI